MSYDPKTNKFPYPLETDHHYLVVKKDFGLVFDENYPYLDNSKKARFSKKLTRILLVLIVFPLTRIRLGLRIKGKENLKKHKETIRKGVLSCCNHVHMWDYLGIMTAIKPVKPNILVWAPNINGENGKMMRDVGGIPIPENNPRGTEAMMKAVEGLLNDGGWLHIYPEGSMWEYYAPIRPFKRGIAHMSIKYDKPIIPLAYSYRKPNWLRRVIFRQIACFTLHVGEPLSVDRSLPELEQEADLLKRCHEAVCTLAEIDPKDSLYPPIFHNDKRVDYYTDTYGVGYKGSH